MKRVQYVSTLHTPASIPSSEQLMITPDLSRGWLRFVNDQEHSYLESAISSLEETGKEMVQETGKKAARFVSIVCEKKDNRRSI